MYCSPASSLIRVIALLRESIAESNDHYWLVASDVMLQIHLDRTLLRI